MISSVVAQAFDTPPTICPSIGSESGLWVEGAAVPATSATAQSSSRERRRSHGRCGVERIVIKVVEPKGGGAYCALVSPEDHDFLEGGKDGPDLLGGGES